LAPTRANVKKTTVERGPALQLDFDLVILGLPVLKMLFGAGAAPRNPEELSATAAF
jgi:hypothetical protein